MDQPYLAMKALLVPNGPGKIPSASRFFPGQLIEFDGDEPIDLAALISCGAVLKYDEHNPEHYATRMRLAGETLEVVKKAPKKRPAFRSMKEPEK